MKRTPNLIKSFILVLSFIWMHLFAGYACSPAQQPLSDAGQQDSPSNVEQGNQKEEQVQKLGAGFLQKVHSFKPQKPASHGHEDFPKNLEGGPQGLGKNKGSTHVVSLGCGGSIILEFSKPMIGDGKGPDFIIFENAFEDAIIQEYFIEPGRVSVSTDGKKWHAFPCQPDKGDWPFPQCAGTRAVLANATNGINPFDFEKAGGDAFDLKDVGLKYARFVKIEDLTKMVPDSAKWCGTDKAGFDLDAIAVRWSYTPKD